MITLDHSCTQSGRELTVTRMIDAPPRRVFAMWTTRFKDWWGPHGMTTPYCEMVLRPGGAFRTVMRAPDGTEYPTRGIFLEIVPEQRIVFTDAFDPDWSPHPDIFFVAITTFEARPDGSTKLMACARHWTVESCEKHAQMGFAQGWGESLDRLAMLCLQG